jgi:hypothetical protein
MGISKRMAQNTLSTLELSVVANLNFGSWLRFLFSVWYEITHDDYITVFLLLDV